MHNAKTTNHTIHLHMYIYILHTPTCTQRVQLEKPQHMEWDFSQMS